MFVTVPLLLASNLLTYGLIARWYVWPNLKWLPRKEAMSLLLLPHTMRGVGLLFLYDGAVQSPLPPEFAQTAAWGDAATAILAFLALAAVRSESWRAYSFAGVVQGFGLVDLLTAVSLGVLYDAPSTMGAAIWIPVLIVPALLLTHVMAIGLLRRCHAERREQASASARSGSEPAAVIA